MYNKCFNLTQRVNAPRKLPTSVLRDVATFMAFQDSSSCCQRSASRLPCRTARHTNSGPLKIRSSVASSFMSYPTVSCASVTSVFWPIALRSKLSLNAALPEIPSRSSRDLMLELTGTDLSRCPRCKKKTMALVDELLKISPCLWCQTEFFASLSGTPSTNNAPWRVTGRNSGRAIAKRISGDRIL